MSFCESLSELQMFLFHFFFKLKFIVYKAVRKWDTRESFCREDEKETIQRGDFVNRKIRTF